MEYIYHVKPKDFIGTQLIPLNYWIKSSNVYQNQIKKYVGREHLNKVFLPKLNCLWNDVLHFSSISPVIVFDYLKTLSEEHGKVEFEYFKIPIDDMNDNFPVALYLSHQRKKQDLIIPEDKLFLLPSEKTYKELKFIPEATIKYWKHQKEIGGQYLLFHQIPHVFVKGVIDTSGFDVCHYPALSISKDK